MWKVVEFLEEEAGPGQPTELRQFTFDLMCAEVFQEESGLWVGAIIDTDGDEAWVSEGAPSADMARWEVRSHLFGMFTQWMQQVAEALP